MGIIRASSDKRVVKEVREQILCGDCGDDLKIAIRHPDQARATYICAACSKGRLASGAAPDPSVQVRHEVLCSGGCGQIQGWFDFPEGHPANDAPKELGYCNACAAKLPPAKANALDNYFRHQRAKEIGEALKAGTMSQADAILEFAKLFE